ncbi:hypothetical protein [Piscirickettsia salmonis]|uniref:hypothetical protein n=1 Tax=Piscirickettsia salmonis TaxID=1238 RepID=UPI0012B92F69|nr:hypothetical protein [Piscirickettsia salmonis]
MLGDFASLDVQNTYRGSDAYENMGINRSILMMIVMSDIYFTKAESLYKLDLVWAYRIRERICNRR